MIIRRIVAVVLAFITAILLAPNASQAQPSCYTGLWERSSVVDMTIELRYELQHAEIVDGYGVASATSIFIPVMLPPAPAICNYAPQIQVDNETASTSSLLQGAVTANTEVFGFDTLSPMPASYANAELSTLVRRITTRFGGEFGNVYFVTSNFDDGTYTIPPASFISKIAISSGSMYTNVNFVQDVEVLPPGEYFEVKPIIRVVASVRFLEFESVFGGYLSHCTTWTGMPCECRARYGSICDGDGDPFNDIEPSGPAGGMQAMVYAMKSNADPTATNPGNVWNGVLIVDAAGSSRNLGVFANSAFNVVLGNMPQTSVDFPAANAYASPSEISQSFSVNAFRQGEPDVNGSGAVDWVDRNLLLDSLGFDTSDSEYDARLDINLDGQITYADFTEYAPVWLAAAA